MSPFIIRRDKEATLTNDLTLFHVARLKRIRREIRQLERRMWWHRARRFFGAKQ
jgi:hypothetical protein